MDVVVDTCCVASVCRSSPTSRSDVITELVKKKRLRVVVDCSRALIDEWKKTAGSELVQALVVQWSDNGGLVQLRKDCKLPKQLSKVLQQLHFTDTCDKLVVRIAIGTTDRIIVSNDPDFWDPKNSARKGDSGAPVAAALEEHEGIRVVTLSCLRA